MAGKDKIINAISIHLQGVVMLPNLLILRYNQKVFLSSGNSAIAEINFIYFPN